MKKVIAILLVLVMVFALAACGNSGGNTTPAPSNGGNNAPANEGNTTPAAPKWPTGEVTIYSGYQSGSLTDNNIVTIRDWIVDQTGAKVTIENNETGGGANLAVKLSKAAGDGNTIMLFGLNYISNYYNGIWTVDPTDTSLFKAVCGSIQPWPYVGCTLLTHEDNPYNNWDELEKYIKENPGKVTVMDIPGKVMDTKTKSIFYQRGLQDDVVWASTDSAGSSAALLGNTINIVMLEESNAADYVADPNNHVKAILNCRPDNDFSSYPDNAKNLDLIKSWPTLEDVFGAELAKKYNVPNVSFFVVPASTPDEIVDQIKAVIDGIGNVEKSDKEDSFYMRQRINGGTSMYYTWDGKELMDVYKQTAETVKLLLGK